MRIQIATKQQLRTCGTTQLRCIQPVNYLRARGIRATIDPLYKSVPRAVDLLILHRATLDDHTRKYIEYARMRGAAVAYDTDDFLFSESVVDYLKRLNMNYHVPSVTSCRRAMMLCDVILTSTPYLASEAMKFHGDVRVVRNALDQWYLDAAARVNRENAEKEKTDVTIAYMSGSASHDHDFKLVEGGLIKLLAEKKHARVMAAGTLHFSEELKRFGDRFTHVDFVKYRDFPRLFANVDINLIPLEVDQSFCQAKSELKYIEAGACGVPSVASPTQAFREVIRHGVNGLLVENDRWFEAIEHLVDHPSHRKRMGRAAREHVLSDYSFSARSREWRDLIADIHDRYGRRGGDASGKMRRLALRLELERKRWRRKAAYLKSRFVNRIRSRPDLEGVE